MKPFAKLTRRGQIVRLRRLASVALEQYDVRVERFKPLVHGDNTTFQVETARQRYVLRVSRPHTRTLSQTNSEMAWLDAISRSTDLTVPQPVRNRHGAFVSVARVPGVPQPRHCALFHWVDGRFHFRNPKPVHYERIGRTAAHLHQHALSFEPPDQFDRPVVSWGGQLAELYAANIDKPVFEGENRPIFAAAREQTLAAERTLGTADDVYNLIHFDLHMMNCLFQSEAVNVIDFDDCGWGHFMLDLAVSLWYVRQRPNYADLETAMVRGYRQVRALPDAHVALLPDFHANRSLLMALWIASRTDNPQFRAMAPAFVARCADDLRAYLAS
jgi:Ser/Thr protein kinase RdoA (MazF antagonist)